MYSVYSLAHVEITDVRLMPIEPKRSMSDMRMIAIVVIVTMIEIIIGIMIEIIMITIIETTTTIEIMTMIIVGGDGGRCRIEQSKKSRAVRRFFSWIDEDYFSFPVRNT